MWDGSIIQLDKLEFGEVRMKIEKCTKDAFVVIGKEGSTLDGQGFIQSVYCYVADCSTNWNWSNCSYRKKHIILSVQWTSKVMDSTCQGDVICIHIVQHN